MSNLLIAEQKIKGIMPERLDAIDWAKIHDKFRDQPTKVLRTLLKTTDKTVLMFAKMVLNERNAIKLEDLK